MHSVESTWRDQWAGAQGLIHTLVKQYNKQLEQTNSNVCLASYLIDAVPLHNLNKIAEQ
mgnify:FL=1